MNDVVIKVEDLSKQYRLGTVGTGTLSHDLNRFWAKIRGKEDPYLKIGESNDRTTKGNSEYVWALKDINFEVKRGEVLGVIGRNGAGKSTLLKILSQITSPTTGSAKMKGRVGALLEVGTGFHPDLTGRENVYINGAILGMRKWEIDKKLDEIISFAGVERYIDTPVKRYSSGMMVRLGFSVAAHLEPEILIVDEVLAVGDAEFQKKCLGSLKDRAKAGRTVLFVSHNLSSLRDVCTKGLLIENGSVKQFGTIEESLSLYRFGNLRHDNISELSEVPRSGKLGEAILISRFEFLNNQEAIINYGQSIRIKIRLLRLDYNVDYKDCSLLVGFETLESTRIFTVSSKGVGCDISFVGKEDYLELEVEIHSPTLLPGEYGLIFSLRQGYRGLDQVRWDGRLVVTEADGTGAGSNGLWGYVEGKASWNLRVLDRREMEC